MNFKLVFALAPLLLSVACGPVSTGATGTGTKSAGHCAGKCDDATVPSDLAISCQSADGQVTCRSALDANYPATIDLDVMSVADGSHSELKNGESFAVAVGTEVAVTVGFRGAFEAASFFQIVTLDSSRTFSIPVDLWPITLTGSAQLIGRLAPQTKSIDPWMPPSTPDEGRGIEKRVGTLKTFLIVDKGATSISGTGLICPGKCVADLPFVFDGPGEYLVSGTSITRQSGTPLAPSVSSPSPDMSPSAPPANVDSDPTCGGDDQLRCADDTCDAHFVFANGACKPCGGEGQLRCSVGGNDVCDVDFVYNNGQCTACGREAQPRCSVGGNDICDIDFVFANGECTACGRDNQLRCSVGGNDVCADGFEYWNGACHTN